MLPMAGIVALAASVPAAAQSLADEHIDSVITTTRILTLGDDGRVSAIRAYDPAVADQFLAFYYDQFRHSQDPDAPYFMFMSKEQNLLMGIGGTVRMRGWYDWGGSIPANSFTPSLIPMDPDPADSRHLGTTPAGTCLFFRLVGRSDKFGTYQAYIEANFNGYNGRDFHLKKAYVTAGAVTVGYASSTFSDPAAVPATVDAAGPNNKLDHTTVLVRYMPHLTKNVIAAVSVEAPDTYITEDPGRTQSRSTYMPDFAGFLEYEWARGQHVRASAIMRSLPYRDLVTGTNHNTIGWGVQASSVAHPCSPLTTYLTLNYGAGYAGLGGDLLVDTYDLIDLPSTPGRLYAPHSLGWCVGIQYNFRPNLFMTLTGSQTRFLPSHAIAPDEYKYGLFGALNIFYNPTPRVQVGAELDLGKRQNFSGDHRYARRFGLMAQMSF